MESQHDLSQPFSAADVDKIIEAESSFAFECQVYRRLCTWFEDAQHGGTYIDPVTKMHREFDIRVNEQTAYGNLVNLAVECKKISPATPAIVLQTLRKQDEKSVYQIGPTTTAVPTASRLARLKNFFPRYSGEGDFVGRSIEQYQRDKNGGFKKVRNAEGIYPKWSQAINSCYELIENSLRAYGTFQTLVIPVLVVPDSCLWLINFDDNGVPSPARQAEYCEVYINVPVGDKGFRITHLEIWTYSSIEGRVTSLGAEFPLNQYQ